MNKILSQKEVANYVLSASQARSKKPLILLLLQGLLAGMFISVGAIGYFKILAYTDDTGLGYFFASIVFVTGIISIIFVGAELFTSNCMSIISTYNKEISIIKVVKILIIILFANLVGTFFVGFLSVNAGVISEGMADIITAVVEKKLHMPLDNMIISAILCNVIVCTGVWMSYTVQDGTSKVIIIMLPIVAFVLSGTEHIVANGYYMSTYFFLNGSIDLGLLIKSLLIVTLGNFIGGSIIVTGINYLINFNKFYEKSK